VCSFCDEFTNEKVHLYFCWCRIIAVDDGLRDDAIQIIFATKNIFNQFQSDFDLGKNRDSNYVYGPALPRTVFIGLKISRG